MTSISFDGRVAIITGAGGGIGREDALELARRGASVLVNDFGRTTAGRDPSHNMADAVVEEIRQAGGTAIANYDSVADTDDANRIVAQAVEQFGKVDILINNAGNWRAFLLEDLSDEDSDAVVSTHLTGSFKTTRAVWPHMKAQGYGRLVYTASSAGLFGMPMVGAYGPAKAGVAGLMHIAALEEAEHGILSYAIMPNGNSRMAMQAGFDTCAIFTVPRPNRPSRPRRHVRVAISPGGGDERGGRRRSLGGNLRYGPRVRGAPDGNRGTGHRPCAGRGNRVRVS